MNNPAAITRAEIVRVAADGNADAERFLSTYAERAHWLDDVADDVPAARRVEMVALAEAAWLLVLSSNPFWLAHAARLMPIMVLGLNGWADSDGMTRGPVRDVVKGLWHETVWATAFLTGGWKHLRSVTGRFREMEYDLEADAGQRASRPAGGTKYADPLIRHIDGDAVRHFVDVDDLTKTGD